MQCFGSGSEIILGGWIRIRIQQDSRAKMTQKYKKKLKKFHVLKCWMFYFEGIDLKCRIWIRFETTADPKH
jgi:hypothetical protein